LVVLFRLGDNEMTDTLLKAIIVLQVLLLLTHWFFIWDGHRRLRTMRKETADFEQRAKERMNNFIKEALGLK
jgi:hypothetical protein